MYKIAITGKANSGKNTTAKLIVKELHSNKKWKVRLSDVSYEFIAFADPLKKMLRLAFPQLPRKYLYGSSKYRAEIIPGAFKEGQPLTIRQALMDLGNDFGRRYQPDVWLRNFDHTFKKVVKKDVEIVVVTDVRFRNEFDHLKALGFFQVRLLRDAELKIKDTSETNQDTIGNSEFDFVIQNNGSLQDLQLQVKKMVSLLNP